MTSTSSTPTMDKLIRTVKEFMLKFRHVPTALVMTQELLERLTDSVPELSMNRDPENIVGITLCGLRIESYATPKECLDRMLRQQGNERLQLVTCLADALDHCQHDFWKEVLLRGNEQFLPPIFWDRPNATSPTHVGIDYGAPGSVDRTVIDFRRVT